MNGLFRTGFRPIQIAPGRYLGQAPAPTPTPAPTPAPTPPSPTPAQPVFVPGAPVVVTPPATVVTAPAPGIPTGIWVLGGLLMIGALAYFASSAARSPRRR